MKLVIIESPYAGGTDAAVAENVDYARRCMKDSLAHDEAPLASHLLYTQAGILDDTIPAQRVLGIAAGLAWGEKADTTAVYLDRGISPGMVHGIERAVRAGRPVEIRFLGDQLPQLRDPGYPTVAEVLAERYGTGRRRKVDGVDEAIVNILCGQKGA